MPEIIPISPLEKAQVKARQLVVEHELEECMYELICDAFPLLDSALEKADFYETIGRHPAVPDFELTLQLQQMWKGNQKFSVSTDNQPKRLKWVDAHNLSKNFKHQYDDDELYSWAYELLEIWTSSRQMRQDYRAFVYFLVTNPDPRSYYPPASAA